MNFQPSQRLETPVRGPSVQGLPDAGGGGGDLDRQYQAWIRLLANPHHQPISNTDLAAVGWRRYGRLAGFTNQKLKYAGVDGKQPYVLI